jgi:hypothetical protein
LEFDARRKFTVFTRRLAIAWALFRTLSKGAGTIIPEYPSPYGQPRICRQRRVIDETQKELMSGRCGIG